MAGRSSKGSRFALLDRSTHFICLTFRKMTRWTCSLTFFRQERRHQVHPLIFPSNCRLSLASPKRGEWPFSAGNVTTFPPLTCHQVSGWACFLPTSLSSPPPGSLVSIWAFPESGTNTDKHCCLSAFPFFSTSSTLPFPPAFYL